MHTVTVYSKPGCHLCEDAVFLLTRMQARTPFTLEEISIEDDPNLLIQYGEQIPVVLLDGKFLFEYAVDENILREKLQRPIS